jgi:adenylosuccinate synthase
VITLQINGKPVELERATPLLAYLEELGVNPRAIAVEHNGTIIERAAYRGVTLSEGDTVEIVRMVGGGQSRRNRACVVLLSGEVAAGKTTLAGGLASQRNFKLLSTRDAILRRLPHTPRTRSALQAGGEKLDEETGGKWVADELLAIASGIPNLRVVVDAVLIQGQIVAVKAAVAAPVFHVHVTAPRGILEARYARKSGSIAESAHYSELLSSATESHIGQLAESADLVIDTAVTAPDDAIGMVLALLDEAAR